MGHNQNDSRQNIVPLIKEYNHEIVAITEIQQILF